MTIKPLIYWIFQHHKSVIFSVTVWRTALFFLWEWDLAAFSALIWPEVEWVLEVYFVEIPAVKFNLYTPEALTHKHKALADSLQQQTKLADIFHASHSCSQDSIDRLPPIDLLSLPKLRKDWKLKDGESFLASIRKRRQEIDGQQHFIDRARSVYVQLLPS